MVKSAFATLVVCAALLGAGAASAQLTTRPDGGDPCTLSFGGPTCFYEFTDSTDSALYVNPPGARISYRVYGDGAAGVKFIECLGYNAGAGSQCAILTDDMDNDGDVDEQDEDKQFTGAVGARRLLEMPSTGPWGKIDVITPPGSGSAYVAITVVPYPG